jgi:hypothetical protein
VLKHETERTSRHDQGELTRDNYGSATFATQFSTACRASFGIEAERREPDPISGQVWMDKHSFLARHIEGESAKNPSWWLRKVRVKVTFANLDGAWMQTGMEAVADVRIVCTHTLTSRVLDYRTVGRRCDRRFLLALQNMSA